MKVIYRISDAGYSKIKPEYINNENCLKNFVSVFGNQNIHIIADNCDDVTLQMITKYVDVNKIQVVSVGNGAGTFNLALDYALTLLDDEEVYFVENDYLHVQNSNEIIKEGFGIGVDFVSLYDHPDKYIDGINPYVEDGGEQTKVFLSNSCHWKFTNSTTMTFAAKVSTLREYESTLRKYTSTTHPHDFDMWIDLRNQGASLITPLPGYSTHGESAWLAPLINWNNVNSNT
jgi:hypothetical protein